MAVKTIIGHALLGSFTRLLLAWVPAAWAALKGNKVREKMPPRDDLRQRSIGYSSRNLPHGLDVCTSYVLARVCMTVLAS